MLFELYEHFKDFSWVYGGFVVFWCVFLVLVGLVVLWEVLAGFVWRCFLQFACVFVVLVLCGCFDCMCCDEEACMFSDVSGCSRC